MVDRGYQSRKRIADTEALIPSPGASEQAYYEKQQKRQRFRRRAGIEPVIGHLKNDHRMRRNFSGELGDVVNCLLAGTAFYLVKRLNQLKDMPIVVLLVMILVLNAIYIGLLSPNQQSPDRRKEHQGYASVALKATEGA